MNFGHSVRSTTNKTLTYDIDGPIQARVKSSVESERIGQINRGDRRLHEMVQRLRQNVTFKTRAGQAQGSFKQAASNQTNTQEREL